MTANLYTKFTLEREDYNRLTQTAETLKEIYEELQKVGNGNIEEINILQQARDIIDQILKGEVF